MGNDTSTNGTSQSFEDFPYEVDLLLKCTTSFSDSVETEEIFNTAWTCLLRQNMLQNDKTDTQLAIICFAFLVIFIFLQKRKQCCTFRYCCWRPGCIYPAEVIAESKNRLWLCILFATTWLNIWWTAASPSGDKGVDFRGSIVGIVSCIALSADHVIGYLVIMAYSSYGIYHHYQIISCLPSHVSIYCILDSLAEIVLDIPVKVILIMMAIYKIAELLIRVYRFNPSRLFEFAYDYYEALTQRCLEHVRNLMANIKDELSTFQEIRSWFQQTVYCQKLHRKPAGFFYGFLPLSAVFITLLIISCTTWRILCSSSNFYFKFMYYAQGTNNSCFNNTFWTKYRTLDDASDPEFSAFLDVLAKINGVPENAFSIFNVLFQMLGVFGTTVELDACKEMQFLLKLFFYQFWIVLSGLYLLMLYNLWAFLGSYKRDLLLTFQGKHPLANNRKNPRTILRQFGKFLGNFVGYASVGFFLQLVGVLLILYLITILLLLALRYEQFWLLEIVGMMLLLLLKTFLFYIGVRISSCILGIMCLEKQNGKRILVLRNRRWFNVGYFINSVETLLASLFSCIFTRVIVLNISNLFAITRIDRAVFPESRQTMDTPFNSYISLLKMENVLRNPTMLAFLSLLKDSRKQRLFLTGSGRIPNREIVRRKWLLAYTLVRNPSLINSRKVKEQLTIRRRYAKDNVNNIANIEEMTEKYTFEIDVPNLIRRKSIQF